MAKPKSFSVQVYNMPGDDGFKNVPENVKEFWREQFLNDLNDPDDIPRVLREQSILIVEQNGHVLFMECDGGEPEDQTLYRNWSWIPGIIKKVYELGLEEGIRLEHERSEGLVIEGLVGLMGQ